MRCLGPLSRLRRLGTSAKFLLNRINAQVRGIDALHRQRRQVHNDGLIVCIRPCDLVLTGPADQNILRILTLLTRQSQRVPIAIANSRKVRRLIWVRQHCRIGKRRIKVTLNRINVDIHRQERPSPTDIGNLHIAESHPQSLEIRIGIELSDKTRIISRHTAIDHVCKFSNNTIGVGELRQRSAKLLACDPVRRACGKTSGALHLSATECKIDRLHTAFSYQHTSVNCESDLRRFHSQIAKNALHPLRW